MCLPIDLKAVQPAMVCGGRDEPSHIDILARLVAAKQSRYFLEFQECEHALLVGASR